jgi:hypothetical protein
VGAPDGGSGLPGVGWSTEHGDLRIPHFFGMHAIQIIPFLGWLISRRRDSTRPIFVLAASYFAVTSILMSQALRGQSIVEPDSATLLAGAVWLATTMIAFLWSTRSSWMALTTPG